MTAKIITVYCVGTSGELIPLSYDGNHYTVETAEDAVRNHGFTVVYSYSKQLSTGLGELSPGLIWIIKDLRRGLKYPGKLRPDFSISIYETKFKCRWFDV